MLNLSSKDYWVYNHYNAKILHFHNHCAGKIFKLSEYESLQQDIHVIVVTVGGIDISVVIGVYKGSGNSSKGSNIVMKVSIL